MSTRAHSVLPYDGQNQEAAEPPVVRPGRFDRAEWRQALRKQRERGCSIYIPAEQLVEAGIDPNGPAPMYLTSASNNRGQRVFVRLRQS